MNDKDVNEKKEVFFLKLKKKNVQDFIQFAKENFGKKSIINQKYKIEQEGNYKLFPLLEKKYTIDKLVKEIQDHIPVELINKKATVNPNFKFKTLKEALCGKIPANYVELIPSSYDIIGNIAILEFEKLDQISNKEFDDFKNFVARAVIDVNKNVISVFEKKSEIKGSYRLRDLVYLTGENKTETVHKENNCVFHLDIKKTFFSPRLVYERLRVSKSGIKENEVIVDMFAGVGPFSIQIAKLNSVEIYAFDLNPIAYSYLKKNIASNKLDGTIFPYNMNVRDLINPINPLGRKLKNKIDRIIMNLPETSSSYIDIACFLMKKSGGILNFYQFTEKPNPIERTISKLKNQLDEKHWVPEEILGSKTVKSYSPKAELVVIDLRIKSLRL